MNASISGRALKILVAEDDPVQRGVVTAMLKAARNEVIEAGNGAEAIAAVSAADALDLVLMDLRMPGMGGMEALDRIRALPGWRGQVPVKAMSARALTASEEAAFDGSMPKGPDIHVALAAAVDEAMQRATAHAREASLKEPAAFPAWMRANWQWMAASLGLLTTGATILKVNTAANTAFDLKLTAVETALQKGEQRDADAAKRVDDRMQDIFNTLNNALAQAAKHSDAREMEIFTSLNKDIADVAGRIDAQDRRFNELRHIRDVEQSDMQQRIAVLESQLRFFADRFDVSSRPPVAPLPVPGKRKCC